VRLYVGNVLNAHRRFGLVFGLLHVDCAAAMQKDPPLRADLYRNFKRWDSKRLAALRDRLARMPETPEESAEEPDPTLIYSKADPRWARANEAVLAELEKRSRGAALSSKGAAGQGKVRGPKR